MATFWNTVSHLHRRVGTKNNYPPMNMEQTVFRNVGI